MPNSGIRLLRLRFRCVTPGGVDRDRLRQFTLLGRVRRLFEAKKRVRWADAEGVPWAGVRRQYLVVTRELTTASNTTAYDGLRPAWHVALATVARIGGAWVVSDWKPQS